MTSTDDPRVTKVDIFMEQSLRYCVPGNYLVEFFTWMKYLPSWMAQWKRESEKGYQDNSAMFLGMFRDVEEKIVLCFSPF